MCRVRKVALFDRESLGNFFGLVCGHPACVRGALAYEEHPDDGPQDRRQAFKDECMLPAERSMRNPVMADIHSTVTGLPSISSVLARERSARVNHRVRISSSAGKIMLSATPSRKRSIASIQKTRSTPVSAARCSPYNQCYGDEARAAEPARRNDTRNLKEEITEKEECSEERVLAAGNPERRCHARGGAKAIVGAVEVREAVGDEDGQQQPAAAAPVRGPGLRGRQARVARRNITSSNGGTHAREVYAAA